MKPLALIILCISAVAVAQISTRRNLTPAAAQVSAPVYATDTIVAPAPHTVDINGYDKPLRSRRETFFVTNNSASPIAALAVTVTYFDSARRQLHSRKAHLPLNVPAGETRQAAIKSWDAQQTFYYIHSAVPARSTQATPYDVTISVDTLFVN